MVVARPSARRARLTSSPPTRFCTMAPVANTSPVVSTAVISITTIIDSTAVRAKVGTPKKNGRVTPTQWFWLTLSKFASPRIAARIVPITRPARTAMVAMKPRNTRWIKTMIASVNNAYASPLPLRGLLLTGSWTASDAATGNSAMPMMLMTEPVTTGGKNRMSLPKYGAMKNVKSPAMMTEP